MVNSQRASKLDDLKERIRSSGLPVRDKYRSPEEFADLVLHDLLGWIDRDYPPENRSARHNASLNVEIALHNNHCSRLSDVFVGRGAYSKHSKHHSSTQLNPMAVIDKYFAMIEEHARGNDTAPLIIAGPTGTSQVIKALKG